MKKRVRVLSNFTQGTKTEPMKKSCPHCQKEFEGLVFYLTCPRCNHPLDEGLPTSSSQPIPTEEKQIGFASPLEGNEKFDETQQVSILDVSSEHSLAKIEDKELEDVIDNIFATEQVEVIENVFATEQVEVVENVFSIEPIEVIENVSSIEPIEVIENVFATEQMNVLDVGISEDSMARFLGEKTSESLDNSPSMSISNTQYEEIDFADSKEISWPKIAVGVLESTETLTSGKEDIPKHFFETMLETKLRGGNPTTENPILDSTFSEESSESLSSGGAWQKNSENSSEIVVENFDSLESKRYKSLELRSSGNLGVSGSHTELKAQNKDFVAHILNNFLEDSPEISSLFYNLKKNEETFENIKGEDILSLIEARQLNGDELASFVGSSFWKPLVHYDEFSPIIRLMKEVGDLDDFEPLVFSEKKEEEVVVEKPSKKKWIALAFASLFFLILLVFFLFPRKQDPLKKRSFFLSFQIDRLLQKDDYDKYQKVLQTLQKATKPTVDEMKWIRAVYYCLDSYGNDFYFRDEADKILSKLMKQVTEVHIQTQFQALKFITEEHDVIDPKKVQTFIGFMSDGDPEWGFIKARLYEISGDFDKARTYYQNLLKKYPNHIPVIHGLLRIAGKDKDSKAAVKWFTQLVRLNPNHIPSRLTALRLEHVFSSFHKFAKTSWKKVVLVVKTGKVSNGIKADWFLIQAEKEWFSGKEENAIQLLEKAYSFQSKKKNIRILRIHYNLESGRYKTAYTILTEEMSKASSLWKKQLKKYELLLLIRLKKFKKAQFLLKTKLKRIRKPQEKEELFYFQGQLDEEKGQLDKAIESYKQSLSFSPKKQESKSINPLIQLLVRKHQTGNIKKYFQWLPFRTEKEKRFFHFYWGQVSLLRGQFSTVRRSYRYLIKHFKENMEGYFLKGLFYLHRVQWQKSMDYFQIALKKEGLSKTKLRAEMAYLLLLMKRNQEAMILFEREKNSPKERLFSPCGYESLEMISLYAQNECPLIAKKKIENQSCSIPLLVKALCKTAESQKKKALFETQKQTPYSFFVNYELAKHFLEANELDRFKPAAMEKWSKYPSNKQFFLGLFSLLENKSIKKAFYLLNEWVKEHPKSGQLKRKRIEFFYSQKRTKEAETALDEMFEGLSATRKVWLVDKIRRELAEPYSVEAIPLLSKMAQLDPQKISWFLKTARVLQRKNKEKDCRKVLEEYLSVLKEYPNIKGKKVNMDTYCEKKD